MLFVVERANQPYAVPEFPQRESARFYTTQREQELAPSRLLLHSSLLFLTILTTTFTGAAMSINETVEPTSIIGFFLAPIIAVVKATAAGNVQPLINGMLFTFTLLAILGAHELGHYFACRHYGIRATLPFFLPAPPAVTLFGTFGAVIKIKEPITSRRALFDIGIAGPLAGFAFALPASIIGLLSASPSTPGGLYGIQFHDPLLFKLINGLFGLPEWIDWNPVYWASWGALLVTALNLFPVGQLDGGHVLYAVVGRRIHKWVSAAICLAVATLAVLSYVWYESPIWFLWTFVLLFLFRMGHPPLVKEEPLGRGRIILAIVALLVFLLCFMPFPITMVGGR
jgi:membrane-associated protease RseP (regulator of RpoE activity)